MSSIKQKQEVWELIKDIKVAMLTTIDNEELRSRPMHLVQDNYDGKIWFFTRRDAAKVFEIQDFRHVGLAFSNPEDDMYVSLSGKAKLNLDERLVDKFWNPFVAAWFPEGKDDTNVALLEIDIYMGEYWDSNSNTMKQLFEIAKANLTDKTPNLGENKKFG